MEELPVFADFCIRRACAFASLAIGTVMLALSFDLPLAFRTGASMTSILCGVLAFMAWRSPRRDVRRTEFWAMFAASNPELITPRGTGHLQAVARRVWRDRLVWHAERIGLAALALWVGAGLATLLQALRGG
jgi:hypothetical protein